jgi:penicillin V acylase-like amidase (Ntn superfamily)
MCTAVKLKRSEEIVLAFNYDYDFGHGLIMTNKRNISKAAFIDDTDIHDLYSDTNKGARWISKYGSITFNQFAREFPNFGMNEAGLCIAALWHFHAEQEQQDKLVIYPEKLETFKS